MMKRRKSHYETLGVAPGADGNEIRTAYRRLARKYHPDAGEGASPERFRDVRTAYEELSDTEKRREYDRRRTESADWAQQYEDERPEGYPRYTSRTVHVDLRAVVNGYAGGCSGGYGKPAAEPIGRGSSQESHEYDDPWDELLDLLFRLRW